MGEIVVVKMDGQIMRNAGSKREIEWRWSYKVGEKWMKGRMKTSPEAWWGSSARC